jgi:hypothetical protein
MCQHLAELPAKSANARLRFALPFCMPPDYVVLRSYVLKLGKYVGLKSLRRRASRLWPGWELLVTNKGDRLRLVPLSQVHIDVLSTYLKTRGLSPDITGPKNPDVYSLGQATDLQERAPWAAFKGIDSRLGIGAQSFHDQLKTLFVDCAASLAQRKLDVAEQLMGASASWPRHTGIADSLAAGTPLEFEINVAGHTPIMTMARYVEARRHLEGRRYLPALS